MTTVTASPTRHQVFNSFDEHGLALGLERIAEESNASYKQRLIDVFTNRASSVYTGLLNGITRELGLSFYDALVISPVTDSNGDYLLTNPSLEFTINECVLVSNADPNNYEVLQTINIADNSSANYWLSGLIDTINATGYFTATLAAGADEWTRSSCIYEQSLATIVPYETLAFSTNRVSLASTNLITGTVSVASDNLVERVSSQVELVRAGQYYIDLSGGVLYSTSAPSENSYIRYRHRKDPFTAKASPVIIGHLQRDSFRKMLFEQLTDDYGVEYDSIVSVFGLDVINELFSVTNQFWGT